MNRRNFLTLTSISPFLMQNLMAYSQDIYLSLKDFNTLVNLNNRLKRLSKFIGYAHFNIISFNDSLFYARNYSAIGKFTQNELFLVEQFFYDNPSKYGFYGDKTCYNINNKISKKDVYKVPYTGHYLFKGKPIKDYERLTNDIGKSLVLTSGVRNVVKQLSLYCNKIISTQGNMTLASSHLAPPAYSYHTTSDFDVGKKGWGHKNFTADFARTNEFQQMKKQLTTKMEYGLSHGMLKFYKILFLFLIITVTNANQIYNFDLIKKGTQDNNTLLIIGGIQGDEPGGFVSASIIATHYDITKGSVWVIPNLNFYSIIKRNRGPYGDMNRKFAKLSKKDPEYATVQRIKNYIKDDKVKLIVNLHDGSGYYRPKYVDKLHSPYRWGQCSIIDQSNLDIPEYGNLEDISQQVVNHVNKYLIKKEDIYHVHNTRTIEGDKEMEKTLTYFAINQGKAAFGNEASKSLVTHKRVYYHLLALEKYMDIMGIEFKRKFTLSPNGVYGAINNDIYISLYDDKIKLPLSKIRNILNYFPVTKDGVIDFKASNPLLTIIKKDNIYTIQYGNRRLSRLKANYQDYDIENNIVQVEVDKTIRDVKFGTIVEVKNNFLVKDNKKYRINVIGYTNKSKKETNIRIKKSQIAKRFSVDTKGYIYRVEYYKNKKFAGMILIKFKN